MILVVLVLSAIGLFVLACMSADTSNDDGIAVSGDIVERLTPASEDEVLRQAPVAVDLAPGWALGALTINGTPVLEQDWKVTAELGLYQFFPAEHEDLEVIKADQNCVEAEAFQLADPTETQQIDWCFTVA
jgi:hypothetical protein